MSDFKNNIQIGIKIDPQNQSQSDLNKIINKLNENKINIDLNIKGDASKQLESLSVLIDTIKSKMGGEISLGNLDKVINNSITGLTKLNGELQKVSQTNFSDGNKKVITETATALGEVVSQTQKFDKNNNVMGDGISRTTTNLIAQQKALQEVAEAQERLNSLTLADNNKVANLKNVFTNISENNGKGYSDNQLSDYLNQVKQLEIEENRLISVKQKETELNTKLNNAEYISSQKSAYKQLFDLQNEEYILKEKLLTAEGKYKEQLESRLVTINQLKQSQQQNIQGNNLTNQQKELELTNQQIVKQEHLNQLRSKIDTQNNSKFISDLQKQNEYLDKSIAKLNQYKQAINTHATNMGGDSTAQSQTISKIDEQITKINQLKESNSLLGNVEKNRINESINGLKQETSALTTHQHSFTDMIKSMAMMATSGALLYGALNKIKDAVQYIIGVENAMIDLRRVVDMNDETAQSFQNSMHNISVQLASTNADTISTVATFAKLGYSIQDATKLGEITTKYNFAADINDINSAATSLIATLKGFGLEANNAVRVTDEINQVSNKFAVTATDVNTILAKSSATMSTFGNTLEESIALGTTANEIMRNASTVGNALKSIAPRLTTNKNALEQLDAFNIKLEDSQGNLKSTYAIFKELSNSMKNLKGEDLAKASNNLFGKQNISTGLAIVKNIEQLDKVMKTLKDSTGSVDQEFNRYLNSTQAKVTQLKENLGGLYSLFLNSTMTKGAVGGLNSFVTAITSVISKMGSLPSVITTVVGALTIFNQRFKTAMTAYQPSFVTNWNKSFTGLKDALSDVANRTMDNITATRKLIVAKNEEGASTLSAKAKLAGYQVQLGAVTIAEKACAISAEALGVAFNMVLGLGIGLAIQAITSFIGKSEELKAENEQLVSSIQTLGSDSSSLEELKNKYATLREEIEKGGLSASEAKSKKQELSSVYDDLIQKSPELKKLLDLESGSYKEQISAIQGVIDKKNEEAGLKAEQYVRDNNVSDSNVEDKLKEITRIQGELQALENNLNRTDLTESQKKNTQDAITNYKTDLSELKDSLSQIIQVQDTLNNLGINNGISSDELGKIKSVVSSIKLYNSVVDDNTSKTNENTNAKENNKNVLDATDIDDETNAEQEKANAIAEATDEYSKSTQAIAQAQSYIDRLNKAQAVTPTLAKQIAKTYPEIGDNINSVASAQEFLNSKIQEQVAQQQQAYEIMIGDDQQFYQDKIANNSEFQNAYDSFLNAFNTDGEQAYNIDFSNYKTLNELKNGTQNDLGIAINQWLSQFVDSSSNAYNIDFSAFKSFAEAKAGILAKLQQDIAIVTQQMNNSIASAKSYSDAIANGMTRESGMSDDGSSFALTEDEAKKRFTANTNYIDTLSSKLGDLNTAYDKVDTTFGEFSGHMGQFSGGDIGGGSDFSGTGGSGGGAGGKGSSGKSDAEKEAEKALKEAVDNEKDYLDDLGSKYEDVKDMITQNVNAIELADSELGDTTDDNYLQKVQLLNDKLNQQAWLVDEAQNNLDAYSNASVTTEEAQKELSKNLQSATSELASQKKALAELNNEMKKMSTDKIKELVEEEKKLAETNLENSQKQITNALTNVIYNLSDFSQSDIKEYIKSLKESLKEEQSDLKELQATGSDTSAIEADIAQKQSDINDLTEKNYSNIKDTQKAYEEIQEQRKADLQDEMDAIDEKLEKMEEEKNAEEEENELAEKKQAITEAQTDLTEKQIELEKLKNQKTIQSYQQQADGTWQFTYTYDKSAVEDKQKEVDDAQSTLDDAKKALQDYKDEQAYQKEVDALNKQKDLLQDQMDAIDKLTQEKSKKYQEDTDNLNTYYENQKTALENSYDDMDKIVDDRFEQLKKTYGDNWIEMIGTVETQLQSAKTQLDELTKIDLTYKVDVSSGISSSDSSSSSNGGTDSNTSNSSNAITDVVKSQFDDVKEYGAKITEQKTNDDSDMLNEQESYQKESIESSTSFLEQQNNLYNTYLELLQNILDWRYGNFVSIASLSTEQIIKLAEIQGEAYNKYVEMYNQMSGEDEDKLSEIDLSSLYDSYNEYKSTSLADYVSDKADLYDISKSTLYSGATASSLNVSSYLNNNGYSTSSSSNTSSGTSTNSSTNTYYVTVSNISLPNVTDGQELLDEIIELASSKNTVKS